MRCLILLILSLTSPVQAQDPCKKGSEAIVRQVVSPKLGVLSVWFTDPDLQDVPQARVIIQFAPGDWTEMQLNQKIGEMGLVFGETPIPHATSARKAYVVLDASQEFLLAAVERADVTGVRLDQNHNPHLPDIDWKLEGHLVLQGYMGAVSRSFEYYYLAAKAEDVESDVPIDAHRSEWLALRAKTLLQKTSEDIAHTLLNIRNRKTKFKVLITASGFADHRMEGTPSEILSHLHGMGGSIVMLEGGE